MEINETNFMQELNYIVTELILICEEFKTIEQDTPITHDSILLLNGRFVHGCAYLPDIIEFIATQHPDPKIVGDKLKQSINLTTEILKEKTRILRNTPQIFRDTNDMMSLN